MIETEYTLEMDDTLSAILSGDRETLNMLVRPAVRAGAEEIARHARENLQKHNSEVTGTAAMRTEEAQAIRDRYGPTISEQVQVNGGDEEISYEVGLHPQVEWIGSFLEYGHDGTYWGHPGEAQPPKPWLRPALDQGQEDAVRAIAEVLDGSLEIVLPERDTQYRGATRYRPAKRRRDAIPAARALLRLAGAALLGRRIEGYLTSDESEGLYG